MHRNRTSVGGEGERGQEQASVVSVVVVVVVVIAAVRAIVIAGASAAIAIGPTIAIAPMIAIPTMIAIPIARHARHAIAIRTTAPVWPPMKANAAAPGDQCNIARGSR